MKKLLLFLLLATTVAAQPPAASLVTVKIDPVTGNFYPLTVGGGFTPNLPAGSRVGGLVIGSGGSGGGSGDMLKADNLAGLSNYTVARSNLGLTINTNVVGVDGTLGTPTSGTLTHATGLPISTGVAGLGTNVGTFLATPSGLNLANALTTALPYTKGGTGLSSLVGKSLQVMRVKSDETGLEFAVGIGGGTGDFVGPSSSTDNAIVRYDGTTGKLSQNSGITIADGATGAFSGTQFTGTTAGWTTGRVLTITGDGTGTFGTLDGTANVSAAFTLANVNSNVGTFGSTTTAPILTLNAKGLVTASSSTTITPAVGSITGLASGVSSFLTTGTSATLAAGLTNETGFSLVTGGVAVFNNGPTLIAPILGSPASGNFSTGTFTWPTFNQDTTGYSSALKSATTTVDVSAATAPSVGQSLVATDANHATWQNAGNTFASSTFGTDNVLLRADGISRNVQATGIAVDDSNNVTGVTSVSTTDTSTQTFKILDSGLTNGLSFGISGTLGADKTFTYAGPYNFTMTLTGNTSLTFPTSGTLSSAFGGMTVPSSFAVGDLLVASGSSTLVTLPDVATGRVLVSGGVTTAPNYSTNPTLSSMTLNGNGLTISGGNLIISGSESANTWTTTGLRIQAGGGTLTDATASTGTTTLAYTNKFGGNTIAATNTGVIYTNYANSYFGGPTAGTNVTITNPWAVISDNIEVGTSPSTAFKVTTGGIVTMTDGAVLGTPATLVGTNITGTAASLTAGSASSTAQITTTSGSSDTTSFPLFAGTNGVLSQGVVTDSGLTYDPTTGTLNATITKSGGATTLVTGGALGTPASGVATNLTGTAASLTAGVASSITTGTTSTNTSYFPTYVSSNSATNQIPQTNSALTYNPSSGALSATSFTGSGSGLTGAAASFNTGGSAASLSVSGQTGKVTLTGLLSTDRIKTVRDAADIILELGGSYTPTGTWTNMVLATPNLGTPSAGVGTNFTGIPESGVTNLSTDLAAKAPLASPTFTGTVVLPSGQALIAPALGTPASGVMTNVTGTAAGLTAGNVTTNANSTGDVTSSGNATTIANNVVTNAKAAQMAANTFKGNNTGSTANAADLTVAQMRTALGGYTMNSSTSTNWSPADSATYYFGWGEGAATAAKTVIATSQMIVPRTGTITRIYYQIYENVNGTNESVSHFLRLNNTTDTTLSTSETYDAGAATAKTFSYTGLSIAVTAGDTIAFKVTTPSWATNPTITTTHLLVYIE